jgi:hypothetical protein
MNGRREEKTSGADGARRVEDETENETTDDETTGKRDNGMRGRIDETARPADDEMSRQEGVGGGVEAVVGVTRARGVVSTFDGT